MIAEAITAVLDNVKEFGEFPVKDDAKDDPLCASCSNLHSHAETCELRQAMDLLENIGPSLNESLLDLIEALANMNPEVRKTIVIALEDIRPLLNREADQILTPMTKYIRGTL